MKEFVKGSIYHPTEGGEGGAGDGSDIDFNGNRAITRATPGMEGVTPGGNNLKAFLENVFYPAVAPVASLSVDRPTREIGENPDYTLTWSVTKKTNPITGITVDGTAITVTGNSQSGTQSGTFPATTGTFTKTMSVTDGTLTGNASAQVKYLNRMFWGTTAKDGVTDLITDADILALAGSELRENRVKSFTNFGGESKWIILVIPAPFGAASFKVNGLANTAFTLVRSNSDFVNVQGATVKVDVYVSDNIYNSPLDSFDII